MNTDYNKEEYLLLKSTLAAIMSLSLMVITIPIVFMLSYAFVSFSDFSEIVYKIIFVIAYGPAYIQIFTTIIILLLTISVFTLLNWGIARLLKQPITRKGMKIGYVLGVIMIILIGSVAGYLMIQELGSSFSEPSFSEMVTFFKEPLE